MAEDRYEIVTSKATLLVNEKIPVVLKKKILLNDKYINKKAIQLHFQNIGNKIVKSLKISIDLIDSMGKTTDTIEYHYVDLNAEVLDCIGINKTISVDTRDTNDVNVTILSILFKDDTKIEGKIKLKEYKLNKSLRSFGNLLEQYVREIKGINCEASKMTNRYSTQGKFWQCVCGNYYYDDVNACAECMVFRKNLEKVDDEEYLLKRKQEHDAMLKAQADEKKKKQEERKLKLQEIKKRTIRILKISIPIAIACIVLILVARFIVTRVFLKNGEIKYAEMLTQGAVEKNEKYISEILKEYEDKKDYKGQIEYLTNIIENATIYGNSYEEKRITAKYNYLMQQYDLKAYDNADLYLDELLESKQYKNDSKLLSLKTPLYYKRAMKNMEQANYIEAIAVLQGLEYEDSKEQLVKAQYLQGKILLKEGGYEQAIELLATVGKYEDAPEQLKEAKYLYAKQYIENKDYEGAIKLFKEIKGYKDANAIYQETEYNLAIQEFEEYKSTDNLSRKALKAIKARFQNVKSYKDASKKISEIDEALKWHGTWDCTSNSYTSDLKLNYFDKTLKDHINLTFRISGNHLTRYYSGRIEKDNICDGFIRSGTTMKEIDWDYFDKKWDYTAVYKFKLVED